LLSNEEVYSESHRFADEFLIGERAVDLARTVGQTGFTNKPQQSFVKPRAECKLESQQELYEAIWATPISSSESRSIGHTNLATSLFNVWWQKFDESRDSPKITKN